MTTDLAVTTNGMVSARDFEASIQDATEKASILKGIVQSQNLSVRLQQTEHLKVEAWITIGKGYGYTAKSESELIRDGSGNVEGAKATATVLDTNGIEVGGADSYCFFSEPGKEGNSVSQIAGMAQTRAVGRAFRELLSWVVVLAGYSATPLEEMESGVVGAPGRAQGRTSTATQGTEHGVCPIHNIDFFQSIKMKGAAHTLPDKDANGKTIWCNKADVLKQEVAVMEAQEILEEDPPIEIEEDGDEPY